MTPNPPPHIIDPVASSLSYPRPSMPGSAIKPIVSTPAPTIPVQAPKRVAITMVDAASPPFKRPSKRKRLP